MHPRVVALAALIALPISMAAAQSSRKNVLSIQPLTAVLGVYSAELERAAGKARSWGVGATYWGSGFGGGSNANYLSAEFKFRGYPAGVALSGFSVGGAVGYTSITSDDYYNATQESFGGPTLGVLLEYQWLLGEQKEWAFTLGAGAKAIFVGDRNSSLDFTGKYPTARVSFGYAF